MKKNLLYPGFFHFFFLLKNNNIEIFINNYYNIEHYIPSINGSYK